MSITSLKYKKFIRIHFVEKINHLEKARFFTFCMASPLCNIGLTMFYSSGNVAKCHINLEYKIQIFSLFHFNAIAITEKQIFAKVFWANFEP